MSWPFKKGELEVTAQPSGHYAQAAPAAESGHPKQNS